MFRLLRWWQTKQAGSPALYRFDESRDESRAIDESIPERCLVAHNSEKTSESMRRYLPSQTASGGGDGRGMSNK
ncbi:hypothetical protein C7B77_20630 [Chamaesiphon polymorphus CCALA 037]|uniref:Uncharacterized protein n=1 Tax=Chamaesiphon polymorphus CCALA 037 TaxID=2107692 RepID=A0A2T1G574_9CYAN|nr:hypothetical protein C7B77_20630 [Chamaesiphon polymorphus CCALA 037]